MLDVGGLSDASDVDQSVRCILDRKRVKIVQAFSGSDEQVVTSVIRSLGYLRGVKSLDDYSEVILVDTNSTRNFSFDPLTIAASSSKVKHPL